MRLAKTMALAATGALSLSLLVGCSSADPASCDRSDPQHIGFVFGQTANSAAPKLTGGAAELLERAATSNGSVTIVTPSGSTTDHSFFSLASDAQDASICEDDHEKAVRGITTLLGQSASAKPDVDYLTAIDSAASVDSGSTIGVVVVGSGLQTAGTLDFTQNDLLYADPQHIADEMSALGELPPSLNGLSIYWSGMGDVADPQIALPFSAREKLKAIWTAVIAKAGGTLEVLPEVLNGTPQSGLPPVTPVPIRDVAIEPDWSGPVSLDAEQVAFLPDSATLSDPQSARELLPKVAKSIVDRNVHVTVAGATSSQGAQSQEADIELSLARAETVKSLLVDLGVPSGLLTTVGKGHEWCGTFTESDHDGKTADQWAAENRRVILAPDDAPLCDA